jgi:hypothetical protein
MVLRCARETHGDSFESNQRRQRAARSAIEPAVGAVSFQFHEAHISCTHGRRSCRHFNQYRQVLADAVARTDENLPLSHIAEVAHTSGFFWDSISVESSGGLNPLVVSGLAKFAARYFVEHVRERINATAAAPARSPPR